MGYSKESERQNKTLGDLLSGKTPEKRVMVGYEGKEQESGDKISRLSDIMKEARMPMFCPKCDVIMKKRLDRKFWNMFNHCFDCQVKFEAKLRANGTYKDWERKKVLSNKLAWIDDMILSVENWKEEASKPYEIQESVGVQELELEKEKWSQNTEQVEKMATEALEEYSKMKEETEKELESIEI